MAKLRLEIPFHHRPHGHVVLRFIVPFIHPEKKSTSSFADFVKKRLRYGDVVLMALLDLCLGVHTPAIHNKEQPP